MSITGDPALEARCRALAETVDLPRPFSGPALARAVEAQQGRKIILRPLPPTLGGHASGMVYRTDDAYVVHYPQNGSAVWGLAGLSHELAHIMCGHITDSRESQDVVPGPGAAAGAANPVAGADPMSVWLPDMAEAAAAWGPLYRCHSGDPREDEAELTGSFIMQRATGLLDPTVADLSAQPPDVLSRYRQVLRGRAGGRRRWRGGGREGH